jgi:hypothetical protein
MTEEQRIRKQYRALRRQWGKWDYRDYDFSLHWLNMARQWKRPVQEIKRICAPNSPYTGNVRTYVECPDCHVQVLQESMSTHAPDYCYPKDGQP